MGRSRSSRNQKFNFRFCQKQQYFALTSNAVWAEKVFFLSLLLFFLLKGWGMSETSPLGLLGPINKLVVGSCGVVVPNTECKIGEKTTFSSFKMWSVTHTNFWSFFTISLSQLMYLLEKTYHPTKQENYAFEDPKSWKGIWIMTKPLSRQLRRVGCILETLPIMILMVTSSLSIGWKN